MNFNMIYILCLLANLVSSASHPILDLGSDKILNLHAATKHSNLFQREHIFQLSNTARLSYIDQNYAGQGSVFFSEVYIESSAPLLLVEKFEHYFEHVSCDASTIVLRFATIDAYTMGKDVCSGLVGGYIISSHGGCNDDVFDVTVIVDMYQLLFPLAVNAISSSEHDRTLTLTVEGKKWNEMYSHFTIEYGHTEERHELRRHESLFRKRSATSTKNLASYTTIIPTATPTETSKVLDLSHEENDSTFSFPLDTGPKVPIEIGCKLCRTTGTLNFTQGKFSIANLSNVTLIGNNVTSPSAWVRSGTVKLEMNDFSAHLELQVTPTLKDELHYTLFSVPIFGFRIPGLGKAGLFYAPELKFDWDLTGGVKFSYGFDLRVPNGSQIVVDLSNPNKSSITGLSVEKTTIKPITFQANISDVELSMSLALRSSMILAFSFLDDLILAEAGAFIDHPSSNISIQQLSTSAHDTDCEGTDGVPIADAVFDKLFKNVTHIVPSVGLSAGLDVQLKVDIPALENKPFMWESTFLEKSLPLPTACLAFQNGSFETATAVLAKIKAQESASASASAASAATATKSTGSAVGDPKKSDDGRVKSPLKDNIWMALLCSTIIFSAGLASI